MTILDLQLKADLENITDLIAHGDEFRWYFKIRCGNCGEENDKWVYCTLAEKLPVPGGKGEANIVTKCPLCNRVNSIDIIDGSGRAYTADHSGQFASILTLDCRGVEPFDFEPRSGFQCKGTESGTVFEDIDLTEKEWTEYDEKAGQSVGILEIQSRFVKSGQDTKSKHHR
eukprot:comp16947_c0_seq1/m.15544 comp16947_c0_seq1/g.15544  ORF comp16947_c0_seq1/g.15544 comp16947_c0_seq1/m.15544 type:complete len:171 (-) comp16947_c0_seq1:486-998(-)